MSLSGSFTRSTPMSFPQHQAAMTEQFMQLASDLAAKQEAHKAELQNTYQQLLLEVNTLQSQMAAEERDYVMEKERLTTEIHKIKINADLGIQEATALHQQRLQEFYDEQNRAMAALARDLEDPPLYKSEAFKASADLTNRQRQLQGLEERAKTMRRGGREGRDEEDPHEREMDELLETKLSEMQGQKEKMLQDTRKREDTKKAQLMEITVDLDNLATSNAKGLKQQKKEMDDKERVYRRQLDDTLARIAKVQDQRKGIENQRRERVEKVREEIESIESEFRSKMRDASRVAEKLKAALMHVNMRKSKELEMERERLSTHSQMLQENCTLKQRIAQVRRQLDVAKQDSSAIRSELASSIGPRRTASLFI